MLPKVLPERDAEAFEREVKRRQQLGPLAVQHLTARGGPTLDQWIEQRWIPGHASTLAKSTCQRYANVCSPWYALRRRITAGSKQRRPRTTEASGCSRRSRRTSASIASLSIGRPARRCCSLTSPATPGTRPRGRSGAPIAGLPSAAPPPSSRSPGHTIFAIALCLAAARRGPPATLCSATARPLAAGPVLDVRALDQRVRRAQPLGGRRGGDRQGTCDLMCVRSAS